MKRIKILLLLFFLATGFSMNAMNPKSGRSHNSGPQYSDNDRRDKDKGKGKGPHTGAPLDGGLLTVLGVGGVAYFVARKKGKKPES